MTKLFVRTKIYKTGRTILAADINNLEDAIVTSLNTMGELATSGLGVSTPFAIGEATADYHAVSLGAFNASLTGVATQIVVDTNASVTAGLGTQLFMQSLTAARTITLPASPSDGQIVKTWDLSSNANTWNIILARSGNTIAGASSDLTMDLDGSVVTLLYDLTNTNWAVVSVHNMVEQ